LKTGSGEFKTSSDRAPGNGRKFRQTVRSLSNFSFSTGFAENVRRERLQNIALYQSSAGMSIIFILSSCRSHYARMSDYAKDGLRPEAALLG
jgi:hypothetical protein